MIRFFEKLLTRIWNGRRIQKRDAQATAGSVDLGFRVVDGNVIRKHYELSNVRRTMHLGCVGKTGTGKSSFIRYLAQQDIEADRGFCLFDVHGDTIPKLLRVINARERRLHKHLSDRVVLIDPSDPDVSIGLNPLEQATPDFIRIAEFSEILLQRWHLDHFGARTDELLRNTLFVLSANDLTLLEVSPFLTSDQFRAACLKRVRNAEVLQYFELRFNQLSDGMRAVMREPILNRLSAFSSGQFRHAIGQRQSTVSLHEAMDEGCWIFVNLAKAKLGEQGLTFGNVVLNMLKNATFARQRRSLWTIYCDEVQNFAANRSGLETLLGEGRKFGVSIVLATQILDRMSVELRSAMFGAGTHVFFQLSGPDAIHVSQVLDGGKSLADRLRNLPLRHAFVKSGSERWAEVRVPNVSEPRPDITDLLTRVRYGRGRARVLIEKDIARRQALLKQSADEVLNDFD